MFIKQVIIQGFRSYRDQTVIDPFSSKHNVIVGRNGSGKSNFFYAIQFVLSDEFSHLRADQRQALLHEGSGPRVLQAFVEIVFDNSDNRLPFDKDEVRLRRVIGAKKDQYFLDAKMVTKADVMNLLESAGFSKSNPYYIVKQGKINELATAADSYRLKLLREVAGTRVYDERKEESKTILKDTENKREKIDELLKYIEERLQTLEEEKEELKEYQKWDKMRRSLEYTIYDHELRETRRKLDEVHEKRENFGLQSSELYDNHQKLTDEISTLQKKIRDLERKWSGFEEERSQLNTEQSEKFQQKTHLELSIRDLREEVDSERSSRRKVEDDLQAIKSNIAEKQERLESIGPRYTELLKLEQKTSTDLAIAEQQRKDLYNKQGWTEQFRSVDERDQWIRKQMARLDRQIDDKREQITKLRAELKQEQNRLEDVDVRVVEANNQLELQRDNMEQHKRQQNEMKQKRDLFQNERAELWREETNLTTSVQNCKDELAHVEMGLRSMTGRSIVAGLDSVQKVLNSFREKNIQQAVVDGYHGILLENFETERKFFTAVEVTAGSRLFYHIVENDRVGTKILDEFNRQKLPGEANFLPLNRLEFRETEYQQKSQAIPMIDKLQYDEKIAVVMKHVFARTLICRNFEVATQLSRSEHMDCVTLDGDQVSHKGGITGGWYDNHRARLEFQFRKTQLKQQLDELEEKSHQQRQRLNEIEGQINNAVSEMQKLETKITKMRDVYEKLQSDSRSLREERQVLLQGKEPKERQLSHFESTLTQLSSQRERLERDLGTELLSQLTADEQESMDIVTNEIQTLKENLKDLCKDRSKLEAEKNRLENQLQTNLLRKREELQSKLQEISVEDRRHLLDAHQNELKVVNQRITEISRLLADLDKNLEGYYDDKKTMSQKLEQFQSQERETMSRINDESKEMEKMANKQSMLMKKKEECTKKIRELGSLPSDAFEKYQNYSMKQLFKKLEECNQELKKYENVNKKALDQFVSFSEQKEKLVKRKEEVDKGHKSILELMDALDQRKYDAIQLTFKQVSKYFEEVFHKLVPGGKAQLSMKAGEDEESTLPKVEQFTGVQIKVSFSGADKTREMQQLSGGQKSLVALALIFAIQKCDPAPFYLFDEVDAAMDPQYRKAVADMVHSLSDNAQFITTTFRPELLEHADKFYGVRFRNKVSHIDTVTKEEAADFVEDDATHG